MAEDYVWIPWDSIMEHCEHIKPIRDVIPEFYVSLSPSSPQGGSWQQTEPTIDNKVYALDTSFTPTQSGSGTPSPDNVRPIVGRTEVNVTVSGINVWDEDWEVGGYASSDGNVWNTSDRIRSKSTDYIPIVPSTQYYSCSSSIMDICFYDDDKSFVSSTAISANGTFTAPSNVRYMRFALRPGYGTTYNNDISINYPSTDHTYHAYTGHTTPVPLGQTVYGGVLDVTNGELTVTYGIVDLGTLNWRWSESYSTWNVTASAIPIKTEGYAQNLLPPMVCEKYTPMAMSYALNNDVYNCISYNPSYGNVFVKMQNNSVTPTGYLVYELATPTTVQLSPTEIELFLGLNNIWSDTGENVHIATADDEQTGMIVTVYGKTLWMRNHIFYKDGTDEYTTPVRIG